MKSLYGRSGIGDSSEWTMSYHPQLKTIGHNVPLRPESPDDPIALSRCLLIDRPAPFVTRLTLNRPAVTNALSLELQAALSRAFTEVATDPQTRCVILTGGRTGVRCRR